MSNFIFVGIFGDFSLRALREMLLYRSARACPSRALREINADDTVGRGPVPRDRGMARDRPSPYGDPGRFFTVDPFGSRCSRTTVFYRIRARRGTGPRPTVTGGRFFYRSAGACPPRALDCADDIKTRRARLPRSHRDREVSPTRKPSRYETLSVKIKKMLAYFCVFAII